MPQTEIDKTPDNPTKAAPTSLPTPPAYFEHALEGAELLLAYAAETGVPLKENFRATILRARAANSAGWNEEVVANLLAALTNLSAVLAPVTIQSLRARGTETRRTIRHYSLVAILLALLIVPFSIASFVTSAFSADLRADITTANNLAVKLRAILGPPSAQELSKVNATIASATTGSVEEPVQSANPSSHAVPATIPANSESLSPRSPGVSDADVIENLTAFAAAVKGIDTRSRQLNPFIFYAVQDPFKQIRENPALLHKLFQFPLGLTDYSEPVLRYTYLAQELRPSAWNILDDVSLYYGAIATYLLPILYALMGTCAYLLRSLEAQVKSRTFTPSHANSVRFLIAGIGGTVVGLFYSSLNLHSDTISPLAIAFLVGYSVDVFFSFLEANVQFLTKSKASTSTLPSGPPPGGTV